MNTCIGEICRKKKLYSKLTNSWTIDAKLMICNVYLENVDNMFNLPGMSNTGHAFEHHYVRITLILFSFLPYGNVNFGDIIIVSICCSTDFFFYMFEWNMTRFGFEWIHYTPRTPHQVSNINHCHRQFDSDLCQHLLFSSTAIIPFCS